MLFNVRINYIIFYKSFHNSCSINSGFTLFFFIILFFTYCIILFLLKILIFILVFCLEVNSFLFCCLAFPRHCFKLLVQFYMMGEAVKRNLHHPTSWDVLSLYLFSPENLLLVSSLTICTGGISASVHLYYGKRSTVPAFSW